MKKSSTFFQHFTFVFRLYSGYTWSWDVQKFGHIRDENKFYLGGAPCLGLSDDCTRDLPIDRIFDEEAVMPLRGIGVYSKSGNNVLLYNFELRLPFLIYYFPAIQFLGQINGAIFCDIGVTWDNYQTYN